MGTPPVPLNGLSSMATRQILADAAETYRAATGVQVIFESIGGVDAARRVRAGEVLDLIALASDTLGSLQAEGSIAHGTVRGFARSQMAIAVRAGRPPPDASNEEAVRRLVAGAATVGYSTGPSGAQVLRLLKAWGLDGGAGPTVIQARPGVPVGSMVARGEAEIGFQQFSELIGEPGLEPPAPLPAAIQSETVFAIGVGVKSTRPAEADAFIRYLTSPDLDGAKRERGLQPV